MFDVSTVFNKVSLLLQVGVFRESGFGCLLIWDITFHVDPTNGITMHTYGARKQQNLYQNFAHV